MRVTLNLCGPPGEATRRELAELLNVLKEDNRLVINAMLNAGHDIPDTVWELGLRYSPPTPEEANTPNQQFYCLADMVENGWFSCGDAAAFEAAVLEEKYGFVTEVLVVPQGAYEYHAVYAWGSPLTDEGGVLDPTEHWLQMRAKSQGTVHRAVGTGANRWGKAA